MKRFLRAFAAWLLLVLVLDVAGGLLIVWRLHHLGY